MGELQGNLFLIVSKLINKHVVHIYHKIFHFYLYVRQLLTASFYKIKEREGSETCNS